MGQEMGSKLEFVELRCLQGGREMFENRRFPSKINFKIQERGRSFFLTRSAKNENDGVGEIDLEIMSFHFHRSKVHAKANFESVIQTLYCLARLKIEKNNCD